MHTKLKKLSLVLLLGFSVGVSAQNWTTGDGTPWKSGSGECWRSGTWTPENASKGCDGASTPSPPAPKAVVQPPVKPAPAPTPAPAPQPVVQPPVVVTPPPAPAPQKVSFSADTFFAFDKAELKPEGKAVLDKLALELHDVDLETVLVAGHTDSVGATKYNQALSVRRAQAVADYLVATVVSASTKVTVEGYGESKPIESNKTSLGRAKNRRVDIFVTGTR